MVHENNIHVHFFKEMQSCATNMKNTKHQSFYLLYLSFTYIYQIALHLLERKITIHICSPLAQLTQNDCTIYVHNGTTTE